MKASFPRELLLASVALTLVVCAHPKPRMGMGLDVRSADVYPRRLSGGWIKTRSTAEWHSNATRTEIESQALQRACLEAILFANGVTIQDMISVYESTDQGLRISQMTKELRSGHITDKRNEIWAALQREGDSFPYALQITLDVKVAEQFGRPDPAFETEVELSRQVYQTGDHVALEIRASRDCYVTVFQQSLCMPDAPVTLLFPNEFSQANYLKKGRILEIPDVNTWRFTTWLPEKLRECAESITVVATKTDIAFWGQLERVQWTVEGFYRIEYRTRALVLAKWLVDIPMDQRTEATVIYRIFRGE